MEQKKPLSPAIAALLIAGVQIIYTLILYFAGLEQSSGLQWVSYLILIVGLVIVINMYGNARDNYVTFGNLFGYGFKTTAVVALIMIVFTVIYFMAFPEVKDKMFETARLQMEEKNMPDSQIEEGLEMGKKMFWPFAIGGIILFYAILGCIGSLIGAAITKKRPVNPLDQMSM